MRAIKYKVKVVRSVLEWSHGMEWPIEEIFIHEKGITFNMAGGDLHVSRGQSERSNKGKEEIEVDDDLVDLLETHLKIREECQKRAKHPLE